MHIHCTYRHTCTYIQLHEHMYTYMYIYIHVHIHTDLHILCVDFVKDHVHGIVKQVGV